MCIICYELIKQNMSMYEARRASGELMFDDFEHIVKLQKAIDNNDLELLKEVLDEAELETKDKS